MKKLFFSALLLIASFNLMAQAPYVSFNTGLNLPSLRESMGSDSNGDDIYSSYGKGLPLNLTVGAHLEDHWGAELGLEYNIGFNSEIDQSPVTKARANQFRLVPSVVVFTGTSGLDFYAKFGLNVALSSKFTAEENVAGNLVVSEYKGYSTIGYRGSFGASYKLTNNLFFTGEVQMNAMRVKVKETLILGNVTSYPKEDTFTLPYSSIGANFGVKFVLF